MALDVFTEGTTEVDLLRHLAEQSEGPDSIARANALCRAAVVLLVSHFESFLKSIAEEYVDNVGSAAVEARRVPVGLREIHTLPKLESIVTVRDDTQRSVLLKRLGSIAALWNDDARINKGSLSAATFAKTVTSAKADVINELFNRMGSVANVCDGDIDIHGMGGEVFTASIDYSLRDVVQCRNDVAHGKADRKPTPEDIVRYVGFLKSFAERLQRKANSATAGVIGVIRAEESPAIPAQVPL